MIALSLLCKTLALALAPAHGLWAGGLWLVSLGLDVGWLRGGTEPEHRRWPAVLRELGLFQLACLTVGFAVAGASDYAAMRWKEGLPGAAGVAAFVLHATGLPVASFGGALNLTNMAGALSFAVSFDNLGVVVPAGLFALSGVVLLWRMPSLDWFWIRLAWIGLLLILVAVARFVFGVGLFLALCDFIGYETEELPIAPFIKPEGILALYVPFLLMAAPLLSRLLRRPVVAPVPGKATPNSAGRPRTPRLPLKLALPLFGLACLGTFWEPLGTPKSGDFVINTFHTEWSRTDRPYDRDWYGADSGYNYACLKRWFGVFGNVREVKTRLTAADLKNASVLMVYLPNQPLSEEEQRLIVEFVRRGGGLLLIGDHTNVFGSTSHLNPICRRFGFYFRDDVLFDLDADFFQLIDMPRWTSAFMHGMTFFKFRGPTSIVPNSLFTRVVMDVGHSKGLRAIYSVNNFYPPPHDHPQMTTGRFAVAVASRFGRGRVAAFADSTIFSNFEIFYPGKYEYLLNTLNWLNHQDGALTALRQRCCALLALGLLLYLLGASSVPRRWLLTLVGALLTAALAQTLMRGIEHARTEFPAPKHPARFLFVASKADEPAYGLRTFTTDAGYEERYDVFIQWILRTGAFSAFRLSDPDARTDLYDHLRAAKDVETGLAFIARKSEDLEQLRQLAAGPMGDSRRVLLMFDQKVPWADAAKALQEGGLLDGTALAQVATAWPAGEVVIEQGERRFVIVASAQRFSDQAMGFSEKVVPAPAQRVLFEQAFSLVDRLFGIGSPTVTPPTTLLPSSIQPTAAARPAAPPAKP